MDSPTRNPQEQFYFRGPQGCYLQYQSTEKTFPVEVAFRKCAEQPIILLKLNFGGTTSFINLRKLQLYMILFTQYLTQLISGECDLKAGMFFF